VTEDELAAYVAEHGHEPTRIRLRRFQLYLIVLGIVVAIIAPVVTLVVIFAAHPGASLSP
jgi:hypothetical protein